MNSTLTILLATITAAGPALSQTALDQAQLQRAALRAAQPAAASPAPLPQPTDAGRARSASADVNAPDDQRQPRGGIPTQFTGIHTPWQPR